MRAANMQALTNDVKAEYPGVVVYGIGDEAHKRQTSGHNEDDTPGVSAELQDDDNIPEHRAIDIMLGTAFTAAQAEALVQRLLADPAARARLYYIIWNGHIWSRSTGWSRRDYTGSDKHTNHVHVSGWAADDENASGWPAVHGSSTPPPSGSKSIVEVAAEVIRGDWGNGADRRARLAAAGYNYDQVQAEVNRQLAGVHPKPPVSGPAHPVLSVGNVSNDTRHVQMFFRNTFPAYRDYVTVRRGQLIDVDSVFGLQTEAWVKEFQRRVGITKDGIIGQNTLAQMRKYGYKY